MKKVLATLLFLAAVTVSAPADATHHGEGYPQYGGWNAIYLDPGGNPMVHECGPIRWAYRPGGDPNFNSIATWVMAEVDNIIPRAMRNSTWADADIRIEKVEIGGVRSGYTLIRNDGWRYTQNEARVDDDTWSSQWGQILRHELMHAFGGHHNNTPDSILRIGWSYPNFGWPDMMSLQVLTEEWRCVRP